MRQGFRRIEVYSSQHGWCVPDMPVRDEVPIYNKPDAERAWGETRRLIQSGPSLVGTSERERGLQSCSARECIAHTPRPQSIERDQKTGRAGATIPSRRKFGAGCS